METLIDTGVELVLETGPGRVLTGLMKRHSRGFPVLNTGTPRHPCGAPSKQQRRMGTAVPQKDGGGFGRRHTPAAPAQYGRSGRMRIDDTNRYQGGRR